MTRRILDSSIWTNEHFGEMPMMARLLLLGIINHADDQGRIKAHLVFLRSQIFPYDDVTTQQIDDCLELIEANGTIVVYEATGKRYIQLLNWWEYQSLQFAQPSDYPRCDEWQDRIRYNAKGGMTLTCNWVTPKGETPVDTCDQDGNPLPIVATLPRRNSGGRPPQNPAVNGRGNPGGNPPTPINRKEEEIEIEIEIEIEDQVEAEGLAPPAAAAAPPNDVARLWTKWDANMPGAKSRVIVDEVNALLDDYSIAEIEEAITIACKRNIRTLSYVEGILVKGVFSEKKTPAGGDYRQSTGEASVDKFFARVAANGH